MNIRKNTINNLRIMSLNQIEKAGSGHPGMALSAAPIIFTLYNDVMRYNSQNSSFYNRDRFILSAGHGSSLLYSTLSLYGFGVTIDDLKKFRKLGSITPGHPEFGLTDGVESTTGPLGQGIANSVGMAIANKHMSARFNKEKNNIISNKIYVLAGDGCMMEGVSQEALSLAGNLNLNNLVIVYDMNNTTIEGHLSLSNKEDVKRKYRAMGFKVICVSEANKIFELRRKLKKARRSKKPTLVIVKSTIGHGSPLSGSKEVHGKPLNKDQINETKTNLEFECEDFTFNEDVLLYVSKKISKGEKVEKAWNQKLEKYKTEYREDYDNFIKYKENNFNIDLKKELENFGCDKEKSIRDINSEILQKVVSINENTIGGCADVAPSTKAFIRFSPYMSSKDFYGNNIHYGVREHAMSAIANGILLYGGLNTFVSTYLSFSDYMRASMRMSAIMNLSVLYLLTHDSILIGEDGATHQPVEHLDSFRLMPNMYLFRPCNESEIKAGYVKCLVDKKPTILALSKNQIAVPNSKFEDSLKGGYIISKENKGVHKVTIIATGSEVQEAINAQKIIEKEEGIGVRVVSLPCYKSFIEQSGAYISSILGKAKINIVVEASSNSIIKTLIDNPCVIGINNYGESGNINEIKNKYKVNEQEICKQIRKELKKQS